MKYFLGLLLTTSLACNAWAYPTQQQVKDNNVLTVQKIVETHNQAAAGFSDKQAELAYEYLVGNIGKLPNYDRALYWVKQSIQADDPIGHFLLAGMYNQGIATKKDEAAFIAHAKTALNGIMKILHNPKSTPQRIAVANYALADLYFWGVPGVTPQDYSKAFQYYMQAANGGVIQAMHKVALMYRYGLGVKEDDAKAFEWNLFLAKLGIPEDQYIVGRSYLIGEGVSRDQTKGIAWLETAARMGSVDAMETLVKLSQNHRPLIERQTLEQQTWWQSYDKLQQENMETDKLWFGVDGTTE